MKLGDKGENVKKIQELLIKFNYGVKADGIFGSNTDKAVRSFQLEHGLISDGIVGPATLDKLEGSSVTSKPIVFSLPGDSNFNIGILDSRSLAIVNTLDEKIRDTFIKFILEAKQIASEYGVDYVAISGTRDKATQDNLFAQGRSKPGPIVTNARYPYSNHNHKLAVDMGCFKNGKYLDETQPAFTEKVHKAVAQIAPKFNLDWGGGWKKILDFPHFEYKTNLTMAQKIERIQKYGSVFV